MKALPLRQEGSVYHYCKPEEATHVRLQMPGSLPNRVIPVILKGRREGTRCWSWNGDTERPTLRPSILSSAEEGNVCHSWVNDGVVEFLSDSTHEHAGKTLDLLEVEE